jgi:hypothetical protein
VGTSGEGTFRLKVTVPTAANDLCSNAFALPVPDPATGSVVVASTTEGAGDEGVPGSAGGYADVWFSFTLPYDRMVTAESDNNNAYAIQILSGDCSGLTSLAWASYLAGPVHAVAGQTYYIAAVADVGAPRGPFNLTFKVLPMNDAPTQMIPLSKGVNPAAPAGQDGVIFTNVGATLSPGAWASCNGSTGLQDVFFSYFASSTCPVTFSMCPPAGFSSFEFDSILQVADAAGGPDLACDDDGCGMMATVSTVTTTLTGGRTYRVRVATYDNGPTSFGGTFYLTVTPHFALTIDAPAGPGSFRIANGGLPWGVVYYTALTLTQGLFPNDWFFGVDVSLSEILAQLSAEPPFFGVTDGGGGSNFEILGLPPLNITLYGVTVAFAGPVFIGASTPVSHTL